MVNPVEAIRYPENYKGHPQLVKEDENGLPLLVPGKFYKQVYSSHRSADRYWLQETWGRLSPIYYMGRDNYGNKECFPCLSESHFKTMFPYFGYCCYWFASRPGGNYVLELVPEEQEIFTRFYKRINQDRHPDHFKAERVLPRADGKPILRDGEIYFISCREISGYVQANIANNGQIGVSQLTWNNLGCHYFKGYLPTFEDDYEVYRVPLWVQHAYHHLAKDLDAANLPHKLSWDYHGVWSFKEGKL